MLPKACAPRWTRTLRDAEHSLLKDGKIARGWIYADTARGGYLLEGREPRRFPKVIFDGPSTGSHRVADAALAGAQGQCNDCAPSQP